MNGSGALFTALLLAALEASAQSVKPVAMHWHQGRNLFVLSQAGEVGVYDAEQRRIIRTFPIARNIRPADLTSAKIFDAETLFVSGFYGRQSVVLQYSPEGKLLNRFNVPDLATGIDVDPKNDLLYVASPISRTVYGIALADTNRTPRRLAYLGVAQTLGPLIYDEPRKRLLVADTQAGRLYAVDPKTGSYKMLTSGLYLPTALAFDNTFSTLYVADAGDGKVQVLSFSQVQPPKAYKTSLRDLTSVARAPDAETVFIGDDKKGVFLFTPKTGEKTLIASR
jgi:outer membrane protein assembly factor BamB